MPCGFIVLHVHDPRPLLRITNSTPVIGRTPRHESDSRWYRRLLRITITWSTPHGDTRYMFHYSRPIIRKHCLKSFGCHCSGLSYSPWNQFQLAFFYHWSWYDSRLFNRCYLYIFKILSLRKSYFCLEGNPKWVPFSFPNNFVRTSLKLKF